MAKRVGRWLGGYVRSTSDGRKVYVIERWGNGARWHISTGCMTERAALKELERFEENPAGYRPRGEDGLAFTADLVLAYRDHQLARGVTSEWAAEVARCLAEWMVELGGKVDLRSLDLHRDLKPALARWTTRRPHRIKALKGFFHWLREERGLVRRAQDPTLDLRVPQARPEKQARRKVVPPEDVQAVLLKLPPATRDLLHFLTATAWHLSEARRFAEGGEIATPMGGDGSALAVLIVRHKSGDLTKTPILYPEHLEAAKRLKERGSLPKRMTLARHMRKACAAAGVPWFGMGQMRHSVLTWGVERGATLEGAAEFAHHRSKATTQRFYVDLAVPKTAVPILRLVEGKG